LETKLKPKKSRKLRWRKDRSELTLSLFGEAARRPDNSFTARPYSQRAPLGRAMQILQMFFLSYTANYQIAS
jgi:hypothetical protein